MLFGGILMIIVCIIFATSPSGYYLPLVIMLTLLGIPTLVAGIVILILRSALFNSRISRRKLLLQQYEFYEKIKSKK